MNDKQTHLQISMLLNCIWNVNCMLKTNQNVRGGRINKEKVGEPKQPGAGQHVARTCVTWDCFSSWPCKDRRDTGRRAPCHTRTVGASKVLSCVCRQVRSSHLKGLLIESSFEVDQTKNITWVNPLLYFVAQSYSSFPCREWQSK